MTNDSAMENGERNARAALAGRAELLALSAQLLQALEDDDLSAEERTSLLMNTHGKLPSLIFSARSDPRASVLDALRRMSGAATPLADVRLALSKYRELLSPAAVCVLLELLADVGAPDHEALAFDLVDHPTVASLPSNLQSRAQAALIVLGGYAGAMSALAMASRIRTYTPLLPRSAALVVRTAASRQPSLLTLTLRALPELEDDGAGPARVELVKDIGRRASPPAFLRTLTELPLHEHRGLVRAAFSGGSAPYELMYPFDGGDQLDVRWGAGQQERVAIASITRDEMWHLDICELAGVRPTYEVPRQPVGAMMDDAEAQSEGDAAPSLEPHSGEGTVLNLAFAALMRPVTQALAPAEMSSS